MVKPNMPNMPGAMADSLEFVKNLWGGMGIPGMNASGTAVPGMSVPGMNMPGMVMPTLSVDEINKKIADLKAVENWLALNMNMLRSTIQALEVQAATIATLQSMGNAFTAAMTPPDGAVAAPPDAAYGGNGREKKQGTQGAPEPTSRDQADAANLTAPLVNAAAWWNMLQDQFKQAVGNAMSGEMPGAASADGAGAEPAKPAADAPPPKRKPGK